MALPANPDSVVPPEKPDFRQYRADLVVCEQKAQTDFDRTVMALSGGALGVSFAFIDKFIGSGPRIGVELIGWAWGLWVASLTLVLASHYCSALAMRRAINRVDNGTLKPSDKRPGGVFEMLIMVFNGAGGILFLAGAVFAGIFVVRNL